jgi:hypothetical protein
MQDANATASRARLVPLPVPLAERPGEEVPPHAVRSTPLAMSRAGRRLVRNRDRVSLAGVFTSFLEWL